MKKILLCSLLIIMCLIIGGCNNKENQLIVDDWKLYQGEEGFMIDEYIQKIWDDANRNYEDSKLEKIVLLGEQVVAGTNYMFLCHTNIDDIEQYKVVIVYRNLEGESEITKVTDFDFTKYVNKNISLNMDILTGGWQTIIPGKPIMLEENIQSYFDEVTENITGISYFPITILATQDKEGINYAILSYGRLSNSDVAEGIFILTIHVDEENKPKMISSAAVDLKDYNN